MASLKLAFVTQFPFDTNCPLGGVEAVSVNLVHSLSAYTSLDIQVVTLCEQVKRAEQYTWGKVTIHRLPKPRGSELVNAITKSKILIADYTKKLKPDLIHAHDTYGIMVNDLSIPKVFTIHGFIYGDTLLANGQFKLIRSKLWEYFEKRSWAKQPNIISISPYVREKVTSVSSAIVYDIDNPISDKFFNVVRNEKFGTIFTSAVICSRKNTLQLVKAVGLLAAEGYKVQLRIAGSIGDDQYAEMQAQWILDNGLTEQVCLLGRLSTEDVMKELSTASIYALTSLEENSPMGIEEAMAAGVPVVTSNRCGMPYMVKNGETGYLVNPFDVQNIADKLKSILDNKELQSAMAAKSKELALDLYHSDNVARRTHAVYCDILTNQSLSG